MSIASEINRISTNVGDALTAIGNKGVTVPAGSNSDDLATLIGQIQQTGSAITITDTNDPAGGIHRTITAVTLDNDTVQPSTLGAGVTAHNALGQSITGTAVLHTTDFLDWMGSNRQYVSKVYAQKFFLKDTGYNDWTPSSTATIIIPSTTGTSVSLNLATKEYWLVWSWEYHAVLNSGATKKAQISRQYGKIYNFIGRRPYGTANFTSMEDNRNYVNAIYTSANYVIYWNTSGSNTWTTSLSYGFYGSNVAATVGSSTATSTTLTTNTPNIYARCSSTYFSTARAAEVNKNDSYIIVRGDLYSVDPQSAAAFGMWRDACSIYGTPLTLT